MQWINRYERVVPISRASLIENILDREEAELGCQMAECEPSEVPFIEQAKALLQTRRANFKPVATTAPLAAVTKSVTAEMALSENPNLTNAEPVEETSSGTAEEDCYYFYQSVDCGNVFLSSLNAKCLISEFGSLKNAPPTVQATMLEIDDYTMDPVSKNTSLKFEPVKKSHQKLSGRPTSISLLGSFVVGRSVLIGLCRPRRTWIERRNL